MCGFVGFLGRGQLSRSEAVTALLQRMAQAIEHRGPDSTGYWRYDAGIALGHRRLSILNLLPAGVDFPEG